MSDPATAATPPAERRRLLLDVTMFWSDQGGGVRRYLLAKRAALRAPGSRWRHVIAAPAATRAGAAASAAQALAQAQAGDDAPADATGPDLPLPGWPLPFSGGYRWPQQRRAAARALAACQPSWIEAGDPYRLAWAALDAGQQLGVPTLAYCHSDLPTLWRGAVAACGARRLALQVERAAECYLRRLYGRFDLVMAPSVATCERLAAWGMPVRHQPLGVDATCFHPRRADPAWRRALGLPPDARVLIYAGRFAPEKQLPVLRDMLDHLDGRYVLVLLGGGPARPEAHPRLRVLPFESRPAALARALASADAFVHAGDQETYGLAPLEAMACGTTVLVRRAGGLAAWVESGVAMGVDENTPKAWAAAVAAAFAAPDPERRLRARQHAEAHDWSVLLPAQLEAYERLSGAGPTRPRPSRPAVPAGHRAGYSRHEAQS